MYIKQFVEGSCVLLPRDSTEMHSTSTFSTACMHMQSDCYPRTITGSEQDSNMEFCQTAVGFYNFANSQSTSTAEKEVSSKAAVSSSL